MASCRAASPRSLIAPPGLRLDFIRTQGLRLVPRRYTLGFLLAALTRAQTSTLDLLASEKLGNGSHLGVS